MKYITRNLENVVNQVTKEYPVVLVTGPRQVGKTTMLQRCTGVFGRESGSAFTYLSVSGRNPGIELVKVFHLLDKSSTPRSKGAVICMKPGLSAIDRDNYIVPIWMI